MQKYVLQRPWFQFEEGNWEGNKGGGEWRKTNLDQQVEREKEKERERQR